MKPESLAALGAVPLDEDTARALGLDGIAAEGLAAYFVSGARARPDLPEIVGRAAKSAAEFWLVPDNQAYLAGCIVGAALVPKMRLLPGIIVTMACGLAARSAYRLADDIRSDIRGIAQNADA